MVTKVGEMFFHKPSTTTNMPQAGFLLLGSVSHTGFIQSTTLGHLLSTDLCVYKLSTVCA